MASFPSLSTDDSLPETVEGPALGEGSGTSPIEEPRVLRRAMCRVASSWQSRGVDALDDAEVWRIQEHLVELLEDPSFAHEWRPDPGAETVVARRLLDLLREEAIRAWRARAVPPSSEEILGLLSDFERLRESLEPEAGEHFATQLASTVGPQLMVEVAHDLRSPLTSILFLAETLRQGQSGDLTSVQRRQLGIIYTAALGLVSMTSDLIDFSRGGDALTSGEPYPFSVAEMLREICDVVDPMAEEKGITIRARPPTANQRLGFPVVLSRVLLNLTTNALKFTESGFVEIMAVESRPDRIEFSVRDTGKGISSDAVRQLYEPFRRSSGRTEFCFSGSGLGLAICRKLVKALGSELHCESQPGWGTRFYFEVELPPSS